MTEETQRLLRGIAERLKGVSPGLFIAFEGGDGSGKSTQIRTLGKQLQELGVPLLVTFEPGATELGVQLRELVQHGPEDVDARTEALLYAADRAYHVATVIKPALASGVSVLTDRYIDSSVAYQGIGRGLGEDAVRELSLWATGGLLPQFVIVLDVEPAVGLSRLGGDKDRLERAGAGFHEKVAAQYLKSAEAHPDRYRVVDASGSVEETFARIIATLADVLQVAR